MPGVSLVQRDFQSEPENAMPSSLIDKFNYDPASKILSIWLLPSGKRYDYCDVPPETAEQFKLAFAKGRFFNSSIRGKFKYTRDSVSTAVTRASPRAGSR